MKRCIGMALLLAGIVSISIFDACSYCLAADQQGDQKEMAQKSPVPPADTKSTPSAVVTPAVSPAAATPVTEPVAKDKAADDMQWLWGEIVSVDVQKKELTVKYLDYETDTEKQAVVSVDDTTTFENVASLSALKVQDAVSIDYVLGPDGKDMAKTISLENFDDTDMTQEAAPVPPDQTVDQKQAPSQQ